MFKKLVMWFFFTVFAGVLPTIFRLLICAITKTSVTYSDICIEIYFFSVIISADGLKELYEINKFAKFKVFMFSFLIFLLIILSFCYGILLLNNYRNMKLDLSSWHYCSQIFTLSCFISDLSIQLIGGITNE